jgi:hypothetical protein
LAIARRLVTCGKGRETSFRFDFGGLGITLCVESSSSLVSSRLGTDQPPLLFPLGVTQTGQVYIGTKFGCVWGFWILVWISVLLGILHRLSSECFGTHRWYDLGVGEIWRLSASGCLGLFVSLCFSYKFMLIYDVCICSVEEIS